MIFRSDNRSPEQIRPVNIVPDFISTAEGSALIEMGNTRSSVPLRSRRRCLHSWRVSLDKSEGAVKDKNILGSAVAPLALPERLRTKALEISR